jgi:hypothetical protein
MSIRISEVLLAPWISGVIITAVRLNVFSIISDQMLTVEEIATKCHAIADRLKPLLDACVSLEILEYENNTYRNSHFSSVYLVEGSKPYVGDFLKVLNYESLQWFQLPDLILGHDKADIEIPWLKTDNKTFISAMNCIGHLGEAKALKDIVDLSGFKQMTDAGGGSGLYSLALCQKYPHLHSTIMDVKETLPVTAEFIANHQGNERITLREGNFLKDPLGDNLDAVLLSDVMYGEFDAKIILKNAWQSLGQNGVLIIRGYYANPGRSGPIFGSLFAVKLIVDNPERKILTISNLEDNVRNAGFEIIKVKPLTEHSFVLVGKKKCVGCEKL